MKIKQLLTVSISVPFFLLSFGGAAQAFECPQHFAAAQAAIDKVAEDMKGEMSMQMEAGQMALVHALLDDAKMWLASGTHNHESPRGMFDHARAIAKADTALANANAADILHFKMMAM